MNRWGYRLYYLNADGEIISERGLGSPNERAAAIDGGRIASESRQSFASWRVVRYEQTERTIAEGIVGFGHKTEEERMREAQDEATAMGRDDRD